MNTPTNIAPMQVALDGPSASGKSTVGAMLADRWDCDFLDTGMMYRAVTYLAIQRSVSVENAREIGCLAEKAEFNVFRRGDGAWRLAADGEDITDALYSEEINKNVSPVSAVSEVRRALVRQQREIAERGPIVMAGRDIGTVVLADALVKIYLDASAATRAARRTGDASGNADGRRYQEVLRSTRRRDLIDSSRSDSPLRPADDAIIVDTDDLSPEEVVEIIVELTHTAFERAVANEGLEAKVS